jgi:hypothetical protein
MEMAGKPVKKKLQIAELLIQVMQVRLFDSLKLSTSAVVVKL